MKNNSNLVLHSYEEVELAVHSYRTVALTICTLTILLCIAGIAGNGMVIRLLGFCLKRNPFTTYVLNLAVADTGVLITSILGYVVVIIFYLNGAFSLWGYYIFACVWAFMYITDQLLLTVISLDRCVAVLFPLWYRCHRPPHMSGTICASIWTLSFLIIGLDSYLSFVNGFTLLQFIVNVAICTPVIAISTIILFVKICTRFQQRKRGKLLPVVSITLFLFLIFGFPVNYYVVLFCYIWDGAELKSLTRGGFDYSGLSFLEILTLLSKMNLIIIPSAVAYTSTVLNCSVNPLIYFLMGRKKKGHSRPSMKLALQRIFKEEGDDRVQEGPRVETQF